MRAPRLIPFVLLDGIGSVGLSTTVIRCEIEHMSCRASGEERSDRTRVTVASSPDKR